MAAAACAAEIGAGPAARAKAAQKPWAARSLEDRIALVKAGVAKLNTMTDVVVEEIAWHGDVRIPHCRGGASQQRTLVCYLVQDCVEVSSR